MADVEQAKEVGVQGGNTDINSTVLGDEKGSVHGETGMTHSLLKSISISPRHPFIIRGDLWLWLRLRHLYHGRLRLMVCGGLRSRYRWAGGSGWLAVFLLTLTDGEWRTVVEEHPLYVLMKSPLRKNTLRLASS